MTERELIFYYAPQTRATGVRILLEELEAPHTLVAMSTKRGDLDKPKYLAVNPLAKVPAIVHGGTLVTEQPAIYTYLADTFRRKALSPTLDDPARGAFLRWMSFYGSSFEPAAVDRALKRDPGPPALSPYGTWDATYGTLLAQLEKGPYMLGDTFSAADVLWGTALAWMTGFGIAPKVPVVDAYVQRVTSRPAFRKIFALDEALAAEG